MYGVVRMPEKTLKKLNTYIQPQWKVCFFAAIIVGLFAHFYKITNWLPNWDSLVFRYDSQNMIALGRWFLPVVCSFSSFYDLPFFNGIVTIIFHALSTACICKILNVQKNVTAFIIGAVIVSFPTVTSVLMYNYVADGYSVAFLLSTVAAMCLTKEKPRYVLSAIMIALSAGIYQAYITVTVMLVMIDLIDRVIYHNMSTKDIFKRGISIFLSGLAGMVLYYIILKILLVIYQVGLLDYQGLSSSLTLSNIDLAGSLYIIKETFVNCFFQFSDGLNVFTFINIVIFIFTLLHYIKYIFINKIYKTPIKFFILIAMGFMLLIGAGILAFINAQIDYHNLMLMGYSVFYLFFIILYERGEECSCIKSWAIVIISVVLIFNQVIISNVSYHKAQMAYERSYGVLIRIADRIEQIPNSDKCEKIMVVGALENSKEYSANLPPDITGITDGYIIRADDETVSQSVLCSALNDYCGKNYKFLSGDNKKALMKNRKVEDMPIWPAKDSIKVVDNTIVIKLGVESE